MMFRHQQGDIIEEGKITQSKFEAALNDPAHIRQTKEDELDLKVKQHIEPFGDERSSNLRHSCSAEKNRF